MFAFASLYPFIVAAFAIELTPGPNMTYLAALGATQGRSAAFAAVLGVALGLFILGLVASVGPTAVVLQHPAVRTALPWVGAAYLCWLAFDGWRDSRRPAEDHLQRPERLAVYFRQGLITNLLNFKAALIFLTLVPATLPPDGSGWSAQVLLVLVYVVIATAVHASIAMGAGALKPYLVKGEWRRAAGWVFAVILVAIAAWLLIEGTK
jgi:threonine/homoserine/homoserine lactone efflux protein